MAANDLRRFMKLPRILDARPKIAQISSDLSVDQFAFQRNCFHNKPLISCGGCQRDYWEEKRILGEYTRAVRQRNVGLLAAQAGRQ
jgi:hypothetical protein